MSHPTNPFLKWEPDSSKSKPRDEALIEISQRLDQCSLEGSSMATDDGAPIFAWAADQPRKVDAVGHGSSQVKPDQNLLHNQITTGRDTNLNLSSSAYNVTASLIQGSAKVSNSGHPESGRNYPSDDDDVAAGMMVPAPTSCILERDSQQSRIIAKLLSVPNAKVAILGMGGIGKTTLACSIANALEIEEAYPRRLFLSFEGCSTPDLAYTNLATAFQVPADQNVSHPQVLFHVLKYLKREKTLFIIDNFETFWEVSSNRRAAENFLAQLAALPKLALIVTLRGIQRPGNLHWFKIDPLQSLTPHASKELLSIITDEEYADDDLEYIQKILNAVAGIPLALTIIGSLLRDNSESPRSLWQRWTRESTRAISVANDADSDDRLYKLDVSLRLSIFSPRMSENTKELMAVIATVPIGLSMDDDWLDRFQDKLPSTIISIRSCINTLRNVALCILEPASSVPRLKLLPPVRDFCLRNMALNGVLAHKLIDMYITDLITHRDWGSSKNYTWVTMELSNISAILSLAITHYYIPHDFGEAVFVYTEWRRFLCIPETDTVERAIEILSEHPQAKARCLKALGTTLSETNRAEEAIQPLKQALSIHRKLEDKGNVGRDLYSLGNGYYWLDDYANAERYLSEARELATELDDKWNKGRIQECLAWVYLRQDKLAQAESAAKEALELCRACGTRKGEVNALLIVGKVYGEQGKYDLAVETITAACDASQVIHDTDAEACANESLGYVYRDANKPDKAALHFQLAISLFEQAQDLKSADKIRALLEKLETSLDTPNNH